MFLVNRAKFFVVYIIKYHATSFYLSWQYFYVPLFMHFYEKTKRTRMPSVDLNNHVDCRITGSELILLLTCFLSKQFSDQLIQ